MGLYLFTLHIPLSFGGLSVVASFLHQQDLAHDTKALSVLLTQSMELFCTLILLKYTSKPEYDISSLLKPEKLNNERNWLLAAVLGFMLLILIIFLTSYLADSLIGTKDVNNPILKEVISSGPVSEVACVIVYCVIAPLLEELVYRRFLLTCLASTMKWQQALIISSAVFSAAHLSGPKSTNTHWKQTVLYLEAKIINNACYICPSLTTLPLWNARGVITILILHVGLSEPFYYYLHRKLHGDFLFSRYHSLHHSSPLPQPFTAEHGTYLEQLLMIPVIAVPVLATCVLGSGSVLVIYAYVLGFDFLRCLGHSNTEIIPHQIFQAIPPLKFLVYTPTYHSLHHTEKESKFCLFMPLFDVLGNTLHAKSWDLHKEMCSKSDEKYVRVMEFVFLAHVLDISSAVHVQFMLRSFASTPFWDELPLPSVAHC